MILDLPYKPTDKFINCFYSLMPMIEQYYNIDLSIIFSHSWNFIFSNTENETLWEKVKPFEWNNIISPFMPLISGLKICKDNNTAFSDISKVIELEINRKNPIILTTDAFCCSWTKFYNEVHYLHHILIIGYDESADKLIGYDSLTDEKLMFNLSILENYFKGIYFFEKSKIDGSITSIEIIEGVLENNKNMIQDLVRFKDSISDLNIEKEKREISNIDKNPLILRLDEIFKLRNNYGKVIDTLKKIAFQEQYTQLEKTFLKLAKEWEICKLHFVKMFLSNREKIKLSIIDTLDNIIENERIAICLLQDVINS